MKFEISDRIGAVTPSDSRRHAVLPQSSLGVSQAAAAEETHGRIRRIERELTEPSILAHHGRLVKTRGNGFICDFR